MQQHCKYKLLAQGLQQVGVALDIERSNALSLERTFDSVNL